MVPEEAKYATFKFQTSNIEEKLFSMLVNGQADCVCPHCNALVSISPAPDEIQCSSCERHFISPFLNPKYVPGKKYE